MNILFVVHNYVGVGKHYGGVELHVRDMVEQFQSVAEHHVWVLCPKFGTGIQAYQILDTQSGQWEEFDIRYPVSWECYQHDDFNEKITAALHRLRIDLVHFFHLIHYPLSFPIVAKQAGVRVVVAFHDYYLVCRKFNLLTENGSRFCGYPDVSLPTCDLCLRRSEGYAPGTQQSRRQLISEILYFADAVHYLCRDTRIRLVAAYPHLETKPELVMGLGSRLSCLPMAMTVSEKPAASVREANNAPLRIACIGNVGRHKGIDLILAVMEYYRGLGISAAEAGHPDPVHFVIFGAPEAPYDRQLGVFVDAGLVTIHGKYQPDDLPRLLSGCDVALFASIWPETFSFVLSEAWAAGIVPIGPRLGAFGERIKHGVTGMLFDIVDDPGSLIPVIDDLAESPEKLTAMRQEIARLTPITLEDTTVGYCGLYQRVVASESAATNAAVTQIYLPARRSDWHYVITESGSVAPPPPPPTRPHSLARRAWGVLRSRGLRYTLWASLNYKELKRG